MRLLKSRVKNDALDICKYIQADYIEPYWMDIKDDKNEKIGILTGYRVNITLFINELYTSDETFIEMSSISDLCVSLWDYLRVNKDLLKNETGHLCFLTNLHLKNPYLSVEKELEVLTLLKTKNEMIVYSCGNPESFDHSVEERSDTYWVKHIDMLLSNGWSFDEIFGFFISDNKERKLSAPAQAQIFNLNTKRISLNEWAEKKGMEWFHSLWKGIIAQNRFASNIENIMKVQEESEYVLPHHLDAIHFMRNLKVIGIKQLEPEGKSCNPHPYTQEIKEEAMYVRYKAKKYAVFFSEGFLEDKLIQTFSLGIFDEKDDAYLIEELLDIEVEDCMHDIFLSFFIRLHAQYIAEVLTLPDGVSLFSAALEGPVLIQEDLFDLF